MRLKNIFKIFKTNKRIKILKKFIKKKSKILEIGVDEGDFSNLLLKSFIPEKLYMVDPWRYETDQLYSSSLYGGTLSEEEGQKKMDIKLKKIKNNLKKQIDSNQVIIIRKNSNEAFEDFDNNFFDLIYIDGNHMYEYVKMDIMNSLKKIKENGVIVCDDYDNPGWWKNGVTKAVNQLCEENLVKKILVKNNQCVIKKI